MKKFFAVMCSGCIMLSSFGVTACSTARNDEKRYNLTVNGGDLLYENLNATYAAGEEIKVKTKIKPYEGVKVSLDTKQLAKSKSTQDEYWQFTFEMPSRDATLDITSFKGFDKPLLYGFYLTFGDKNGEPIEAFNKPVDSEEAIADYFTVHYDEKFGSPVFSENIGANVFADGKSSCGNNKIQLENTLYYTYELLDAVAYAEWIYFEEETQKIYSYDGVGTTLNKMSGLQSLSMKENLSDTRYTSQMKEYEETFDSFVKINFAYLDYLTGVTVKEFDANNQLIASADIEKSESEITHTASENCEYVIIEEEYTVKSGEHIGEKHIERTLINRKNGKFGSGKILKFPRGDGLISPVYLSVK